MDKGQSHLEALFSPRSVAVIGASESFGKWGFGVFSRLLKGQGAFRIYPVNQKAESVLGLKAYRKVTEIPDEIDLAVVVIPPEWVPAAMADCAQKGVKTALVITDGFREIGPEGAALESEMLRIARQGGIRVAGPNGNGHFHTGSQLFTSGGLEIKAGAISIVSQSGNFGGFILDQGTQRGIGFNKYISSGNEADLTFEDYLEFLGEDEGTKVICGYVEGLKDGKRFFNLAKAITARKPVILLKAGNTPEGAGAALSHTGSMSGSAPIHEAVFKQTGVIPVERVDQMLDVASALIRQPLPRGKRVGIVAGGGGFGVVAADACRRLGLQVPPLSAKTIESLDRFMQSRWSHANPVDMAGDAYLSTPTLGAMLKSPDIDAVLGVSCIGFVPSPPEIVPESYREDFIQYQKKMMDGEQDLMKGLMERIDKYGKPLIIAGVADPGTSKAVGYLVENDIYPYRTPEDGARVLYYLSRYAEYLKFSPKS
jgi:acyl-CoA synthetase (NDP forming)